MLKNKKGFTLIELLVVIAIIGILSAVVLASLNSARAKAKSAAFKAEISSISPAAITVCDTPGATLVGNAALAAAGVHNAGSVGTDCTNGDFQVTFTPTTGNGGTCTSGIIDQTGTTFAGC